MEQSKERRRYFYLIDGEFVEFDEQQYRNNAVHVLETHEYEGVVTYAFDVNVTGDSLVMRKTFDLLQKMLPGLTD